MTAMGIRFYRSQNAKAAVMGGAISKPKIFWLMYAVTVWFFMTPLVGLDPAVSPGLKFVLLSFAGLMWARGIAEMYMLYVSKNWAPPIGITHDAVCIVWLLLALGWKRDTLVLHPVDRWVLAFAIVLTASLVLEICYAALFFKAVEGKTKGPGGIWFADPTDPRYLFINRLTFSFNVPLFAFQAVFLAATSGLFGLGRS